MGNYRAATTDNVSRLPKHWLCEHDRALYGAGLLGEYNGKRALYWAHKTGTFVSLVHLCRRIWWEDRHAVIFRLSDGKVVFQYSAYAEMNPALTPFFIAQIDDGKFVAWTEETL
jgi:hypothetical protein